MFKRFFRKTATLSRAAEVQTLHLENKPLTRSLLMISAEIMDETDKWFKDALGKDAEQREERTLSIRAEDACNVFALSMHEKAAQHIGRRAVLPGEPIPTDLFAELAYTVILGINACSFVQKEEILMNPSQIASSIIRAMMIMQPEEMAQLVGNRALEFVRIISGTQDAKAVDWRNTTHQLVRMHIQAHQANVLGPFAEKIPSLYGGQLRGLLSAVA